MRLAKDSPFAQGGRTPSFLTLVASNGVTVHTTESPPSAPTSPVGTLDPSITPAIAADNIAIIANDNRPLVIRLLSGLISAITVAGEAYRFARSIPGAVHDSYQRATAPL